MSNFSTAATNPWTCPLKHISHENLTRYQERKRFVDPLLGVRTIQPLNEPERISNEPGPHHGSCWRIDIHSQHHISPELEELKSIRFIDSQLYTLLQPQELVYWSDEQREWVTHTFSISFSSHYQEELRESWSLRKLFTKVSGKSLKSNPVGTYLLNPDNWKPIIAIEPEYILLQLRDKDWNRKMECKVLEKQVALQRASEVVELLRMNMNKSYRIVASKRIGH